MQGRPPTVFCVTDPDCFGMAQGKPGRIQPLNGESVLFTPAKDYGPAFQFSNLASRTPWFEVKSFEEPRILHSREIEGKAFSYSTLGNQYIVVLCHDRTPL